MDNSEKLNSLVIFARQWFVENNVKIPTSARDWQTCSVNRKEIPPGCTTGTLRRLGTTAKWFIESIQNARNPTSVVKTDMDYTSIGFTLVESNWRNGHKKCTVRCNKCLQVSSIDYGTLARMRTRQDMYCYICRGVGGKAKPLSIYNRPEVTATDYSNGIVTLVHTVCGKSTTRTTSALSDNRTPVCEYCYPEKYSIFGTKVVLDGITFPSKLESEVYVALKLLALEFNFTIIRQIQYSKLFTEIASNHTADFYIPEYNLIIEAGGVNTGRYVETIKWKLSLAENIVYISNPNQVDDIVRPLLKDRGVVAKYGGNVLCCSSIRR